ncbi:MAG: hypothetical protein ACRDPK_20850 [Carbonactinosporaceae bacterium]
MLLHIRRVRRERGRLFDRVMHLLDDARLHPDGLGFPTLTGSFHGHPVRLAPLVDTLAMRKLPVLWLLVTMRRPLRVEAPLDVLLRPAGTEFFSPNSGWLHELSPPDGFPRDVRIATPDPVRTPPPAELRPYLGFLSDPSTKELYIARHGLRAVVALAEGSQAHYRVTRRADLGAVVIEPLRLIPALRTLAGLGDALAAGPVQGSPR